MYQYKTSWSNCGAGPIPATQVVQSWRYYGRLYHSSLHRHVTNFQTCIIAQIYRLTYVSVAFGINLMCARGCRVLHGHYLRIAILDQQPNILVLAMKFNIITVFISTISM